MIISHMAIYTQDLEKLKGFYCRWFGGTAWPKTEDPEKGCSSCFISFGPGARLELIHCGKLSETVRRVYNAGYAHLAFSTKSEKDVENLTEHMKENGIPVVSAPKRACSGLYESCILDPDGNRVEITAVREF